MFGTLKQKPFWVGGHSLEPGEAVGAPLAAPGTVSSSLESSMVNTEPTITVNSASTLVATRVNDLVGQNGK